MNDILGILIPMLMSGAGIGDIVRALGGAGQGAAGSDGLSRMVGESIGNARMAFSPKHNEFVSRQVSRASEMLVDRLGIVPTSGLGQGLTSMLGGMYHLAPDTFGAVLGVPNGGQFFGTVANGASGISRAAGFGQTDIFNPYSVMASHERTMKMAETAYGLGMRKDGGYNIDFTHGLNMDEMGKVTQRLLSSDIAFTGDNGERLDPESEKFKEHLKKLGSKFNEAASMLSKVTGSVEEALTLMDRLGGGNFLGGTAEQATEVANRAKKMATAIRVTSAIAGISPQEAYANMRGLQGGMATGMGMNGYVAEASGFSDLMRGMAFNGTMGYNNWAAMNPDATPMEKQQALFVANGRAQSYATSNGASLAAAVADNANLFSKEELDNIKAAYREGRPNDVVNLVRERIGSGMFTEYMTDQALQVAARKRASEENPDLLNDIDQAGMEGNLVQAERFGAKRILNKTISDIGSKMSRLTGDSGFSKLVNDAGTDFLRRKAVENGLTEEAAGSKNATELRRFLKGKGIDEGTLEQEENTARVNEAKNRLDSITMNSRDERAARQRLIKEINGSTQFSDSAKRDYVNRLNRGEDITKVYSEFSGGMSNKDAKDLRQRIFDGKITATEAEREKSKLDRIERSQGADYTSDERMRAIENDLKRSSVENMGRLKIAVAQLSKGEFGNLSGKDAIKRFSEVAKESGAIKDDKDLKGVFGAAANRVVSNILGDKFGDLEGEKLDKFKSDMAKKMLSGMEGGKTIKEAFEDVKSGLTDDQKKILDKAVNDKNLSNEAFFSAAASEIDSKNGGAMNAALEEMKKLSKGEFGNLSGKDAIKRFSEVAKESGAFKGSDEELQKITEEAYAKYEETGKEKDAISGMLGMIKPKGTKNQGFYATAAAGGMNQAALVMAASMAKMSGLDMSKLKLLPGMEDLVSAMDDISADSTMNRIPNALGVGGANFTKEAVETTKKQVGELGKLLQGEKGISAQTLSDLTGKDADKAAAARTLIENTLSKGGRSNVKSDMALIEAVSESKIGGVKGVDALLDSKKLEAAKKGKGSEEDFVNVTKQANRKDSDAYGILKAIGDFTRTIAPFIQDPSAIFKNVPTIPVRIEEGSVPVEAT